MEKVGQQVPEALRELADAGNPGRALAFFLRRLLASFGSRRHGEADQG